MTEALTHRDVLPASRRDRRQPDDGRAPALAAAACPARTACTRCRQRCAGSTQPGSSRSRRWRSTATSRSWGGTHFAGRAFPEGWAVQAVLRLACARVAGALEPRKGEFLQRWVAGESIAGIAVSTSDEPQPPLAALAPAGAGGGRRRGRQSSSRATRHRRAPGARGGRERPGPSADARRWPFGRP